MAKKRRRDYMAQADTLFAKIIKARDDHCVRCGSRDYLQCAHIISRSYKSIRCDLGNAVALCRACHKFFTDRPLEWEEWCDEQYPGLRMRLRQQALDAVSAGTTVDWRSVLADLHEEAKRWAI